MTALRRVDADFLALPRHLLADAAVSAALAAGASYADLRIHRITTEHIQLRDGERTVVSHFAKHTRGLVARALLEAGARETSTLDRVADVVARAGDGHG